MEYNVVGGKCLRGMAVINTYAHVLGRELTNDEYEQAAKLGWLIELLQASLLVADDIEDGDEYRRDRPSWHMVPDVGMIAINDACLLKCSLYVLLRRYFGHLPCYADLVELFHETTVQTELGQMLDLISARRDKVDLSNFTVAKCERIAESKTAFYTVYAPILLGLYLGGAATPETIKQTRKIAIPLGRDYQYHDDYLDCFGALHSFGKEIGRDIKDGKCTWPITQALIRASPAQWTILQNNYGRDNPIKIKKVLNLLSDLQIPQIYQEYAKQAHAIVQEEIARMDGMGLNRGIFDDLVAIMYDRQR